MARAQDNFVLVVDSHDIYAEEVNVFQLKPEKMNLVRCLDDNRFSACKVLHTPVDKITPLFLSQLLNKLAPTANVSIIIDQPITVMQDFDAKQVEANAKLAGYVDVSVSDFLLKENDFSYNTKILSFVKPSREEKQPQVVVKSETKVITQNISAAAKRASPMKK